MNKQHSIKIGVTTEYLGVSDQTEDQEIVNVFTYSVNITNESTSDVQLISRYWLITNGDGDQTEVRGEGVVGKQPIIKPGDTFTYTSASMIKTEVGTMQGFYMFETPEKEEFKAPIPIFTLAVPNKLN
ncbi:MAG: Co2+/Mg2+ efflux protein ApaG [Pseudomonadota bacterium]